MGKNAQISTPAELTQSLAPSTLNLLMKYNWDPGVMRPYVGGDGQNYMTIHDYNNKAVAIQTNTDTTLRKDDWKALDEAIVATSKKRMRAVNDLRARGLTYMVPGGWGKTILETERIGEINDAQADMDPVAEGINDRPEFDMIGIPLPVIHKDFSFSARQLATSRQGGSALDTTMGEMAGWKVAEFAEKLLLGKLSGTGTQIVPAYGGYTLYGYTNWPSVLTQTLTTPVGATGVGATLVGELLTMRETLKSDLHFGPYATYCSSSWDRYLDEDYKAATDKTVRMRVGDIDDIAAPITLDYLSGYEFIMVQMTSNVVRQVIGMEMTTLQWPGRGGLALNFKVMMISVPNLRADKNSNTGICYGSV